MIDKCMLSFSCFVIKKEEIKNISKKGYEYTEIKLNLQFNSQKNKGQINPIKFFFYSSCPKSRAMFKSIETGNWVFVSGLINQYFSIDNDDTIYCSLDKNPYFSIKILDFFEEAKQIDQELEKIAIQEMSEHIIEQQSFKGDPNLAIW